MTRSQNWWIYLKKIKSTGRFRQIFPVSYKTRTLWFSQWWSWVDTRRKRFKWRRKHRWKLQFRFFKATKIWQSLKIDVHILYLFITFSDKYITILTRGVARARFFKLAFLVNFKSTDGYCHFLWPSYKTWTFQQQQRKREQRKISKNVEFVKRLFQLIQN